MEVGFHGTSGVALVPLPPIHRSGKPQLTVFCVKCAPVSGQLNWLRVVCGGWRLLKAFALLIGNLRVSLGRSPSRGDTRFSNSSGPRIIPLHVPRYTNPIG